MMVQDVLPHPGDIGLFGAERIMAIAEGFAVLVEEFFPRDTGGKGWRERGFGVFGIVVMDPILLFRRRASIISIWC